MQPRSLSNLLLCSIFVAAAGAGCVVHNPPVAAVTGLTSLAIVPPTTTITLDRNSYGLAGTVSLTATGMINGASEDMTTRVQWASNLPGAAVSTGGVVKLGAPGTYTITVTNGTITVSATVVALEPPWPSSNSSK